MRSNLKKSKSNTYTDELKLHMKGELGWMSLLYKVSPILSKFCTVNEAVT